MYDAIQKGFKVSTGEIMAYINSDDKYYTNAFYSAATIFSGNEDVDWILGRASFYNDEGTIVDVKDMKKWSKFNYYLGDYQWIQQESIFWRRRLWLKAGGKINTDLKYAGDYELWLRFFRFAKLYSADTVFAGFRFRTKDQLSLEKIDSYLYEIDQVTNLETLPREDKYAIKKLKFFQKYMSNYVSIGRPQSIFWHKRDTERRVILSFIFLAVYLTIFIQAAQGTLTPGQAVTVLLLAYQVRIPIFTISFLVDNTQKAIADSKDYFSVMQLKADIVDSENATELKVKKGDIEFQNVTFGYDDETSVLKDLSFNVKAGTKVALVGESGEGKTTVTSLLMRLYEQQQGSILIDGQDTKSVTQKSLRSSIGVVFQEPALFSGTISENISYGNTKATIEQITFASKAANAHEFICKFEKGYDSEIGERGLKLSGGQKQRIAIARAILKDAPILVLDEATSSLDNKSELLVQEALERLMKGRTTIIIAHRLSTIQNVDTIVTIMSGQIDEVGTPKALSHTKGIYAKLLSLSKMKSAEDVKKALQDFDLKI